MAKAKAALEHEIWQLFKRLQIQDKKILVSLSGGVDSLALLLVLNEVLPKENIAAFHFHHGDKGPEESHSYRDQALKFCQQISQSLEIPFHFKKATQAIKTEEEFRNFRYRALEDVQKSEGFDLVSLGHHADDLLESRLLRLIRGTGLQGLGAMKTLEGGKLRPFIEVSKDRLVRYLAEKGIKAFEDPSNSELDPMRNWLRLHWLVSLEKRQPGASASLGRSIERIVAEYQAHQESSLLVKSRLQGSLQDCLSRSFYLTLLPVEQRVLLAQYMYSLGRRDFSQAQIEEIQKHLDNPQKMITFKIAGCVWIINAEQIKVQKS